MFIQENNNIVTIMPNLADFYGNLMSVKDKHGQWHSKSMQLTKAKARAQKILAGLSKYVYNGEEPVFYCDGQELEAVNLRDPGFTVKMNPKALGIQQPEDFEKKHIKITFIRDDIKWSQAVAPESSVYQGPGFFILDSRLVVASNVPSCYLDMATLATQQQIESIRSLVASELEVAVRIEKPTQKTWSTGYHFVILNQSWTVEYKKIHMAAANCPPGWYFSMGRNTLMIRGEKGEVYAVLAMTPWDLAGIHAGMETEVAKWPKGNNNITGDLS